MSVVDKAADVISWFFAETDTPEDIAKALEKAGLLATWAPLTGNTLTRIEVIDEGGRAYTRWGVDVGISIQDKKRTIKLFVSEHVVPGS